MRRSACAAALLVLIALALAACGGSGGSDTTAQASGPLAKADLVAAADGLCTDGQDRLASGGIRGASNPALAAEFALRVEVLSERHDQLSGLEPAMSAKVGYQAFLSADEAFLKANRAVLAGAKAGDTDAVDQAFTTYESTANDLEKAGKALGAEVCGVRKVVPDIEKTGTGPGDAVDFTEPANTIDEAANSLLSAVKEKDCNAFNAQQHSDVGLSLSAAECKTIFNAYQGDELGTESYGPAGVLELGSETTQSYTILFVEDLDGKLKYTGAVTHDSGGLRPAEDGAQEQADDLADAVVGSIRDNDPKAFNATLPIDKGSFAVTGKSFDSVGQGMFGAAIVDEIRKDDGLEPQFLGINAAQAYYLLDGADQDFVLVETHQPGNEAGYRFQSYWPIKPN